MRNGLLATAFILAASGCVGPLSEDFESHYQAIAAARADGAFARGWLPEIVPGSATDIWEFHNIDTNLTWACFRTPDGPEPVRALLAQRGAIRMRGPIDRGPTRFLRVRPWWPSSMATDAVEAYSVQEAPRSAATMVGIDTQAAMVCLHAR
jgi:hypothetical protein